MAHFLVELYLPRNGSGGVRGVAARARSVTDNARALGGGVRYVRSIFMPEDELCLELYEAPSAEAVREAAAAGRRLGRIVEAIEFELQRAV
jgi:hypothetical protein